MERSEIKALLANKIQATNIKEDEKMSNHTTFKIGGPVDFFVTPTTKEEVAHAILVCYENKVPYYIIGNGSNLLVPDEGLKGVAIEIYKQFKSIHVEQNILRAEAGVLLSQLAQYAQAHGLTGLEFAHGIPGTLGGAVAMNAGAYGGEIKDVILEATVVDQQGNMKVLDKEALALGYRTSSVSRNHYTVVEAKLQLKKGDSEKIKEEMKRLASKRREKQPLEYPSAGSTFKRPEGYFAGKLIMDSGLRGYQIGGARVSDKHCGFIINAGNATCKDVKQLICHIQQEVKKQFGVTLETEVKLLGDTTKRDTV